MSHTPGPWATCPPEFTDEECWTVQEDGGMTVRVCGGDSPENRANANLIAAAPELLEELKEAEKVIRWAAQRSEGRVRADVVNGWLLHAKKIASVIAKAEGRGE